MDYENRVNNLWNRRIQRYESYRNADKMGDRFKGRSHGGKGVPEEHGDAHPYHDALIAQGRIDLTSFDHEAEQLQKEMQATEDRLNEEEGGLVSEKREQVLDRFNTKLDMLDQEVGPHSSRHASARQRAEQTEEQRHRIESDLGRGLQTKMERIYPVVFLLVALLEVPINRYAFEYFFEETPVLALGLALGFGFAFAAFAHWTGSLLKHAAGEKLWKKRVGDYVATVGILTVTGTAIYFLALMRERYIQFQEQSARGLGEFLAEDGLRETAAELLSTELTEAGWTLLLLNLIVFIVGTFCAYQRHDPHPYYESVTKRAQKAASRYNAIQNRYDKKRSLLTVERDEELQRLEQQAERVAANLAEIENAKNAMRDCRAQAVKAIAVHIHARLNTYELANRLARDHAPKAFGRYHEEKIRGEIASGDTDVGELTVSTSGRS